MNENTLSERLKLVVDHIPNGSRIADIGSDHAYLPCYAYLQGVASYAIAGEVNEGPYCSAQEQVNQLNLQDKISVRKGNGLAVINEGEVDAITIAGMGGPLIASILEDGKEKLQSVKRLILQPNVAAIFIRQWLENNSWELIAEDIVEEDGKIYEVLVAEQGKESNLYEENRDAKMLLGPYLMTKKSEAFIKKWSKELDKYKRVANQIKHAQNAEDISVKLEEVMKKINIVEEVLQG